jgi:hypothetical protein
VKVRIKVKNSVRKWLHAVGIVDEKGNPLDLIKFRCNRWGQGCKRINEDPISIELTIDIPIYYSSSYRFPIKPFVAYAEQENEGDILKIKGDLYEIKISSEILSSSPIELEMDLQKLINVSN